MTLGNFTSSFASPNSSPSAGLCPVLGIVASMSSSKGPPEIVET